MKQEPPLDAKCRDKFLVQSVPLTADKEFANIGSIVSPPTQTKVSIWLTGVQWQHVDNADKASVQEKKIRVVFLPAQGSTASLTPQRNGVNGYSNVCAPYLVSWLVFGQLLIFNRAGR
jgi:hypothetical protein